MHFNMTILQNKRPVDCGVTALHVQNLGRCCMLQWYLDLLGYSYEHVKTLQLVAPTTFLSNLFDECSFFLIWSWSWLIIRRICMLDALLFQFPNRSKSTSSITKASVSYIKVVHTSLLQTILPHNYTSPHNYITFLFVFYQQCHGNFTPQISKAASRICYLI